MAELPELPIDEETTRKRHKRKRGESEKAKTRSKRKEPTDDDGQQSKSKQQPVLYQDTPTPQDDVPTMLVGPEVVLEEESEEKEKEEEKKKKKKRRLASESLAERITEPPHPDAVVWVNMTRQMLNEVVQGTRSVLDKGLFFIIPPGGTIESAAALPEAERTLQEQFTGLALGALDTYTTCCIFIRQRADVQVTERTTQKDLKFRVDLRKLAMVVKEISAHKWVLLFLKRPQQRSSEGKEEEEKEEEEKEEEDVLHVMPYVPGQPRRQGEVFRVNLERLPDDKSEGQPWSLADIDYDHAIELQGKEFRKEVTAAKTMKSEVIRFEVTAHPEKTGGPPRWHFLTLHMEGGRVAKSKTYAIKTEKLESSHMVEIRNSGTQEDDEAPDSNDPRNLTLYNNAYPASIIQKFVKGLEGQTIQIRLPSGNAPMVMTQRFGDDQSFAMCAVAPRRV